MRGKGGKKMVTALQETYDSLGKGSKVGLSMSQIPT